MRRLPGFDQKVLSLYARGLTVRELQAHLEECYQVEVSPAVITAVTDAVLAEAAAWQQRPLEPVYIAVVLDGLRVKIRTEGLVQQQVIYLALGIRPSGEKEVLGFWLAAAEGAAFWQRVLSDLQGRGVQDILIALVDGLPGFPDAIHAVFPQTVVHQCVVHLVRQSLAQVNWRERKAVASALRGSTRRQARRPRSRPSPTGPRVPWAKHIRRSRRCGSGTGSGWPRRWRTRCRSGGCSTRPTRSRACTGRCGRASRCGGTSPPRRRRANCCTWRCGTRRRSSARRSTGWRRCGTSGSSSGTGSRHGSEPGSYTEKLTLPHSPMPAHPPALSRRASPLSSHLPALPRHALPLSSRPSALPRRA
ncbi:MAG: transposase [Gemmatimonadetes bacterium]|nr:transposase [Gemmatimonadota bacterium]